MFSHTYKRTNRFWEHGVNLVIVFSETVDCCQLRRFQRLPSRKGAVWSEASMCSSCWLPWWLPCWLLLVLSNWSHPVSPWLYFCCILLLMYRWQSLQKTKLPNTCCSHFRRNYTFRGGYHFEFKTFLIFMKLTFEWNSLLRTCILTHLIKLIFILKTVAGFW